MTLWRISNHATLDGGGGLRASSRWHTRGRRIVYCAPNPATALLEVLVHAEIDVEDLPVAYRHLQIEAPDSTSIQSASLEDLGSEGRFDIERSRRIGDAWLRSGRSALLLVPCVIVPAILNVLLNPQHPDSAQIRIVRVYEHPIDPRLRR